WVATLPTPLERASWRPWRPWRPPPSLFRKEGERRAATPPPPPLLLSRRRLGFGGRHGRRGCHNPVGNGVPTVATPRRRESPRLPHRHPRLFCSRRDARRRAAPPLLLLLFPAPVATVAAVATLFLLLPHQTKGCPSLAFSAAPGLAPAPTCERPRRAKGD